MGTHHRVATALLVNSDRNSMRPSASVRRCDMGLGTPSAVEPQGIHVLLVVVGAAALILPAVYLIAANGTQESEGYAEVVGVLVSLWTASIWITVLKRSRGRRKLHVFSMGPWVSLGAALLVLSTLGNPVVALGMYLLVVALFAFPLMVADGSLDAD